MTVAERLASFAAHASYESLSEAARQALKAHVLDALGCAIGALDAGSVEMVRAHVDEFGSAPLATARPGMRHYRGAIVSSISLANLPMVNAAPKSNLLMAMNTAAFRVGAKAT